MFVPPTVITSGPNFTEAGHVITLRGIDMATALAGDGVVTKLGGNFVRIRVSWAAVEPTEGHYDPTVLSILDSEVKELEADKVQVLIDFHSVGDTPEPSWAVVPNWWTNPESLAEYEPFVKMMVNRYQSYPNVMGFEVWNEPQGAPATPAGTNTVIRWQAQVVNVIRNHDPDRAIVVMLRSAWDTGLQEADLAHFGNTRHLVLDVHDQYCGCYPGNAYSANGEDKIAARDKLVNEFVQPYAGTLKSQNLHLEYVLRWRQVLDRPILVGEWEDLASDPDGTVYQAQMFKLFNKYHLSWARWQGTGGKWSLFSGANLNAEGQQIQEQLTQRG